MNLLHSLAIVIVAAVSTFLTRATPFILFGRTGKKVNSTILYLGRVLPAAVMATLLIYALKGVSFKALSSWAFDFGALLVTILVHLKWRNTLLSITLGTLLYMVLVQGLFW
ncbi:MAG: AzlD domain-containing protein [Sphaerochaetaceae bacterium]